MKKMIPMLLALLLLTGCGRAAENEDRLTPADTLPPAETEATVPEETTAAVNAEFPEFDSITDAQVIALAQSQEPNTSRIPDYYLPADGDYTVVMAPEASVPVAWYAQMHPNGDCELIEETDLYQLYENGGTKELLPRYFLLSGNDYAYYTGAMDEQSIRRNFDILAHDEKMLCRRFRDDAEIKCVIYEYYAVTMMNDTTAELGWYCYLIDRENHLVSTRPEWNQKRQVSLIPEETGSGNVPSQETDDAQYDILLRASERELLIGRDDPEVIWYAEVPAEYNPQEVALIDAANGETAAVLYDLADYEKVGDTIQGDGVYNCRFKVNTDIDTDPDVSESAEYSYYAEFEENGTVHRSEPFTITVMESFTDREMSDMERVDAAIEELMESDAFRQLSTEAEKADALISLLKSQEGVEPSSIVYSSGMVSFQYTSGAGSGIMLNDFDPMLN